MKPHNIIPANITRHTVFYTGILTYCFCTCSYFVYEIASTTQPTCMFTYCLIFVFVDAAFKVIWWTSWADKDGTKWCVMFYYKNSKKVCKNLWWGIRCLIMFVLILYYSLGKYEGSYDRCVKLLSIERKNKRNMPVRTGPELMRQTLMLQWRNRRWTDISINCIITSPYHFKCHAKVHLACIQH